MSRPVDEPSNRLPWIALAVGVLVIVLAVVIFFLNQRPSTVSINSASTLTPNAVAQAVSPGPPPTLVPPTLPPSASLAPTATPQATPTPQPTATRPPAPTATPVPPTAVPVQAAPTTPPPPAAAPAASPAASPVAANAGPPATQNPAAAAPTPFAAQVSAGGGLGNTRADMDAAYGQPVGETAQHLVVYRKNNFEYHVELTPDLNGRAAVIGEMPAQGGAPLPLEQAQAEAHRLLPSDAQPPNQTPEGNPQYVVERYTSQSLAQALPAEVFSPGGGQPGQFMIVYARDAQGRITRWVLGPGNDANALLAQAQ